MYICIYVYMYICIYVYMYVCVCVFNMFVVLIIVYSCGDACHHWPPGFQVDHLKVAMANLDHRWRVTQRAVGLIDLVICFSAQSVFEGFVPCCFFSHVNSNSIVSLVFWKKILSTQPQPSPARSYVHILQVLRAAAKAATTAATLSVPAKARAIQRPLAEEFFWAVVGGRFHKVLNAMAIFVTKSVEVVNIEFIFTGYLYVFG